MRTLTLVAGVVALVCLTARPALAQQDMRGDLAVSYSVLHDSTASETFPAGIIIAIAADLNKKITFVGEFGGNYKTTNLGPGTNVSQQVLTYQAGLRFARHGKAKVRPFVQFLAGAGRASTILLGTGSLGSHTGFAAQGGVGVDFRISDRFDGRLQFDYRGIRSTEPSPTDPAVTRGVTNREFRIGFGIVFPFGR